MSKILVAFFSPDISTKNSTRKIANLIAEVTGGDMYEIKPAVAYEGEDLNWDSKNSRSSSEMADKNSRPELADKNAQIENYDVIYLGFPIWWYVAPHIINTFLETYKFNDKKVITFATSDGSSWGDTLKQLRPSSLDAQFIEGRVFRGRVDLEIVANWIDSIEI